MYVKNIGGICFKIKNIWQPEGGQSAMGGSQELMMKKGVRMKRMMRIRCNNKGLAQRVPSWHLDA